MLHLVTSLSAFQFTLDGIFTFKRPIKTSRMSLDPIPVIYLDVLKQHKVNTLEGLIQIHQNKFKVTSKSTTLTLSVNVAQDPLIQNC